MLRFMTLAILTVLVGACSNLGPGRPGRAENFVPGVAIPEQDFEITDFGCQVRTAEMFIDGELVEGRQWWGMGTITNLRDDASPNWEIAWDATLDDGTQLSSETGATVFPLEPGASTEFSFLVASDRTLPSLEHSVASCVPRVENSVLNG